MRCLSNYFTALGVWASLLLTFAVYGQTPPKNFPVGEVSTDFADLLQLLSKRGPKNTLLPPPVVYRDSGETIKGVRRRQYEIHVAAQPLGLRHRVVQLLGKGYPVSYSVLYQGCLVALFKNGQFGCFRLTDFEPDERLEHLLNTDQWQKHWLIDQQLIALHGQQYYVFDQVAQVWQPYQRPVPFGKRPKLYEDSRYLAYDDCNGEFGGTVYFFNKATQKAHWANATCANSVWQEKGQYRLLASLGHMMGSAAEATIADPEKLPLVSTPKNDKADWQYDFTKPEKGVVRLFEFVDFQLFSGFRWQNQTVYLTRWRRTTFLSSIANNSITIIDPLFSNGLYAHRPVTTSYGPDLVLTNLDFYGLGGSDEVATLLWQGSQLTKIEWGEQPKENP